MPPTTTPTTLGQIVAIGKEVKTNVQAQFDDVYHILKRPELFVGLAKEQEMYEGFGLPQKQDNKLIQANATEILKALPALLGRLYDLEATKDYADTQATAPVVIDDDTLLDNVPVSHLLWLEKQAHNLVTVFKAIPVPSSAEKWVADAPGLKPGELATPTETQPITKKVTDFKVVVEAAANGNHPADVREVSKDVQSGVTKTTKFTAALPAKDKELLVNRAQNLLEAIKKAIPIANQTPVTDKSEAESIFGYLFDGIF